MSSSRKITQLGKHLQSFCGCTVLANPENCVYQPFLDGWDFTTDVGNGQSRGEIFTPRFIVDKMIAEGGIIPEEAIYKYNYSTLPVSKVRKVIKSKVFEPAVGTGNFSSTILWHKIQYANQLATNKNNVINEEKYQLYTLEALASIYVNDIDCGNLEAFKWRILRISEIYSENNIGFWKKYFKKSLSSNLKNKQESLLTETIKDSLTLAAKNWGVADEDKGVLDVLYYKHVNRKPPEWLKILWKEILDSNSKLFNSIKEEDTIEDDFLCPGWQKVEWVWWEFQKSSEGIIANKTVIPMALQIYSSQKENLEQEIEELLKQQKKQSRKKESNNLIPKPVFLDEEDKKKYQLKIRELSKLGKRIQHLEEHGIKVFKEVQKETTVKPNQDNMTLF